jgi:hypothetical protein
MFASLKFKFMGDNTNKMLYMITTNQNFLRYIKYLDNDPLNTSKPDVAYSEVQDNFAVDLFDEEVLEETKIKVFFSPLDGMLEEKPIGHDIFILDIVIPKDFWKLEGKGEFRAFQMAHEVALKLDGKNVAGIGDINIIKWRSFKINNQYRGLTLWIKVGSMTIK